MVCAWELCVSYAELAVTTNFSFLRGASHPHELIETAVHHQLAAIGIADRNSLAGVVRAYDARKQIQRESEAQLPRLLVGARLVFAGDTPDILAYPVDREAYGNLSRLITTGKLRAGKGECSLSFGDLLEWQSGLLLIVMPPTLFSGGNMQRRRNVIWELTAKAPGRVWLAASMLYTRSDRRKLRELRQLAREANVPLIAVNDVLYHMPERRTLQDVVTCIREHVTLDNAGKRLEANAERHLKPPQEMARLFRAAPDAIAETLRFAARINFSLDQLSYRYPDEPVPPGKTPDEHLADLTWKGAAGRYPGGIPDGIRAILEKELALIATLNIAAYFLTVHDIVRIANEKQILCQGRGSAANSAVCYALGVTAVNPAEIDLLFERFVSAERKEPPDIDVDFEHERREEVIQDVYRRYGHERAALTATVITYRARSAIREAGKVFGLTEDVTAALVGGLWGGGSEELARDDFSPGGENAIHAGPNSANELIARVLHYARELLGFPRHLSQHAGGFVLTRDRLDTIVPIGPAAMEDRYFIEWDKDDIDALGIMKVDVLALGMLTCIRKAFDLIAAHENRVLTLATVPREDRSVYDMLCRADAIGVFQVESRAQMNMLPRLRPRKFYDLVIEVAIVRPGPIQGDMVHPYLRRRSGAEPVEFPSPSPEHGPADELYHVLHKTMGVPLFQEQAMRLAIVAAKFTPDEANGLRRAMATFRNTGSIDRFREKLVSGMTTRGYSQDFAERCFQQIEGFGSYGFPESHAASFAHLVYISAWIKCHHPAAFGCALLNSQPMGFYAPAEIVRDAQEHDVQVLAPDVNANDWDNTLERGANGLAIRLGFRQIDGFHQDWAREITAARSGGYSDFREFVRRAGLRKPALMALAEADAFRSLGLDRREALWAVRRMTGEEKLPLFAACDESDQPGEITAPLPQMPLGEQVVADYQTLRLSLKGYPTQFLRERFARERIMTCRGVGEARDAVRAKCAGVVLVRQMPGTAGVVFVTLSDETGICNVVIWPKLYERFRKETIGARLMLVEGKIQRSPEGVVHLVAERIFDRTADLDLLSAAPMPVPGHFDDIVYPRSDPRGLHRHPREMKILPKSRDFH
jgi:error-prone DNA polymerase